MKKETDYNEIKRKKDSIGLEEVNAINKLDFSIGVVWDPLQKEDRGNSLYYMSLSGIIFQISEQTAKRVSSRIFRIQNARAATEKR